MAISFEGVQTLPASGRDRCLPVAEQESLQLLGPRDWQDHVPSLVRRLPDGKQEGEAGPHR